MVLKEVDFQLPHLFKEKGTHSQEGVVVLKEGSAGIFNSF